MEAILKEKITSIDLSKNPVLRKGFINDKMGILDIVAKINGTELCNIEMQIAPQDTIIERLLFYWGKIYSRQIKSGDKYDKLQKTIVILISDFNVKGLEKLEYHTKWKIIEEKYRKTILTDKLEIHIIELCKITNLQKENDELLDWLAFLENPKSERVIIKMEKNTALKEANEKFEQMCTEEQLEQLAWWRYKGILEENSAKSEGMKRGLEEGRKEGRKEGIQTEKITIAKEMLKLDIDIETIIKVTKLSIEEIEKLKKL